MGPTQSAIQPAEAPREFCRGVVAEGVDDDAVSVFSNPLARIFSDEEHSAEEPRELMIGHSSAGRLLLVYFTELVPDRVRIIGTRRATKEEQHDYEEQLKN